MSMDLIFGISFTGLLCFFNSKNFWGRLVCGSGMRLKSGFRYEYENKKSPPMDFVDSYLIPDITQPNDPLVFFVLL